MIENRDTCGRVALFFIKGKCSLRRTVGEKGVSKNQIVPPPPLLQMLLFYIGLPLLNKIDGRVILNIAKRFCKTISLS